MRIVVAEDSALMRAGLVALLERAGHEILQSVATATELVESVTRFAEEQLPDLVLADVRMPPNNADDGLRAAVRLRAIHAKLPIMLLSQYLGNEYLDRMIDSVRVDPDAGGVGYLLKDRVAHVKDFMASLEIVASGGVVVDRKVVSAIMRSRTKRLDALTDRELAVLRHVSTGATNQQIARTLHLSEGAVVKHVGSMFDKLGLNNQEGNRRVLAVLAYLADRTGDQL